MADSSITRDLIRHITSKEITDHDLQNAAIFTLDAVATAYAGKETVPGQKILQWADQQGKDAGRRAFTMGALTHITETDDLHRASVTHPGCVVVPAALAVGEEIGASGKQILTAILHGFEAMCRIGMGVGPTHYKLWHNTATCGPFGSAMAVASLLNLSEEQTLYALGNAGTQSSGLWEFLKTGAMSKHLHAGRAAEAGLLAAQLAQLDFTGPPEILEGEKALLKAMCDDPEPELILSELDSPWQLNLTSIKPWPSCRHTHPVIDAALEIQEKLKTAKAQNSISAIKVKTYQTALDVCDRADPSSEYEAKFSLQHCVAAGLFFNPVDLTSFDEEARERTADYRKICQVEVVNPYQSNYPKSWGSEVLVTLSSGEEISASRLDCKGDPELPLSPADMQNKAMTLLKFAKKSEKEAQAICQEVLSCSQKNQSPVILNSFFG